MILSIVPVNSQATTQKNKTVSADSPAYTYFVKTGRSLINPVVFTNKKKGDEIFEVSVGLQNAKKASIYTLSGYLNGDNLFKSNDVTAGDSGETKLLFNVKLDAEYQGFVPLNNRAIDWQLIESGEENPVLVETTNLEIYFIPNKSTRVAPHGIPIELMRKLAKHFNQASEEEVKASNATLRFSKAEDEAWTIQQVVDFAFNHNPPRYDITRGASHFIQPLRDLNNITLKYNQWLAADSDPTAVENCYDMASVAQYLLNLLAHYETTNLKWAFMNPFGYLTQTNLIGRGQCNNPFYGQTGGAAIVAENDSHRTRFGNHAFVKIVDTDHIVDACAGPHYGTETPTAYVNAAVDPEFPLPSPYRNGTVADISYYTGVTSTSSASNSRETTMIFDEKSRNEFISAVGYTANHLKMASDEIVSQKWSSPLNCKEFNKDWYVGYEETTIDSQDVVKFWRLQNGDQTCEISIYISSIGGKDAHEKFIGIGSAHSNPEPIFKQGHTQLGEISAQYNDESRHVWIEKNLVFDVESRNSMIDLKSISNWLNAQVNDPGLVGKIPVINSIKPSSNVISIGDTLTVNVDCSPGLTLSFEPVDGLEVIDIRSNILIFKATEKADVTLTVLAVNEDTGISARETVSIEVK
jgi:hypothetical protein